MGWLIGAVAMVAVGYGVHKFIQGLDTLNNRK